MKKTITSVSISLFLLLPAVSAGQDPLWNVVQTSGDTLLDCSLFGMGNSRLSLESNRLPISIAIDSISYLYRFQSHSGTGMLVGAAVGLFVGAAATPRKEEGHENSSSINFPGFGNSEKIRNALAGAVGGFIVGGIIGSIKIREEVLLHGKSFSQRLSILKYVLEKD